MTLSKEKNTKIQGLTHQKMSVLATVLGVNKGILTTALIEAAMSLPTATIREYINSVTNNELPALCLERKRRSTD